MGCLLLQLYGLWHLKGGMYSFIYALSKLIYELGGKINTNVNVRDICFQKIKLSV